MRPNPTRAPRPSCAPRRRRRARVEPVAVAQGSYYLVTGIWPLLHMRSFVAVTGPKTDLWLVRTVGALVAGVGIGVLRAGVRGRVPRDLRLVAVLSAAGLVAVEMPTVARGRISPIYLMDAFAEGVLLAGWARAARST